MKRFLVISLAAFAFSCGSNGGNGDTDGPPGGTVDGDPNVIDADPLLPDAFGPPNCMPGATQCSDCIDNDSDGVIDGFDPECTGNIDDDEGSFATGIPGDNQDEWKQDCFFDGNSGGGNDCAWHTCCQLVPPPWTDPCPVPDDHNWDPASCDDPQTTQCIMDCAPITPPGCDCFGCCTVCDDLGCEDIIMNSTVDPECDFTTIHDPTKCFPCFKNDECGTPCDPANCILCPGQDPSDLPPECNGTTECPGGAPSCVDTACPEGLYCSNGCCITIID